jgi:bromodomain-containing protein 7/9
MLEKVENYRIIVKEPMDFGTIRAEVHEGMYTSLEQFKVYKISYEL